MARLKRSFCARPADELARALLGCVLVRVDEHGRRASGMIVETEAYLAPEDRASHAFGNRRTTRNEPMFMKPGTSYVYFTYGMHHCMNVSAGAEGLPHAVLLRALEPIDGLEAMRERRRGARRAMRDRDLCSGPGKLCQALGIDRAHSGMDLCSSREMWLEGGAEFADSEVARSPRIGISGAGEWVDAPLRWLVVGNPHVSKPA